MVGERGGGRAGGEDRAAQLNQGEGTIVGVRLGRVTIKSWLNLNINK